MAPGSEYNPTPEEIAAACAEIRSRWSDAEAYRRMVSYADSRHAAKSDYQPEPYTVPLIRVCELADALAG